MDDDITLVLERYSACNICTRENTKLCQENVDYKLRQIYFTTPYKKMENEITKYCKYFNLNPSRMNKLLCELTENNEKEKIIEERIEAFVI
ncbi:MAG: hypothetical protein ACXQTP_01625 [Candidatus Methanofastidiosia archaeon]